MSSAIAALGPIGNVLGAGAKIGGELFGANAEADGVDAATRRMGASANRLQAFIDKEYGANAPIRQAGQDYAQAGAGMLPSLIQMAQNPTMSAGFQRTADEGLRAIRRQYGTMGSASSGASQLAAGRYMTGLGDAERQRQIQQQQFLGTLGVQGAQLGDAGSNILNLYPTLAQLQGAAATGDMTRGALQGNSMRRLGGYVGDTIAGLGNMAGGMGQPGKSADPGSASPWASILGSSASGK